VETYETLGGIEKGEKKMVYIFFITVENVNQKKDKNTG
jgi:hypothetical protein